MSQKIYDIIPPQVTRHSNKKTIPQREQKTKAAARVSSPRRFWIRGLVFAGIIVLLLTGIGVYPLFASVTIVIHPSIQTLEVVEAVIADSAAKSVLVEDSVLPGTFLEVERTLFQNFLATGTATKEEKARGTIRVFNEHSTNSQALLATTRFVSADGKLFRSIKREVIPGGHHEGGKFVAGYKDIEVRAADSGEDYNIGPSTFSIPGFAGTAKYTSFYGKSSAQMTGGFKGGAQLVTEADHEQARQELITKLKTDLAAFLRAQAKGESEEKVFLESAIAYEVLEETFSTAANTVAESFDYRVVLKAKALTVNTSDIVQLAKARLAPDIPEGKQLHEEALQFTYTLGLNQDTDSSAGESEEEEGAAEGGEGAESETAMLEIAIEAPVYSAVDVTALERALLGKSFKEVRMLVFGNHPDMKELEIKAHPLLWNKRLPDNRDRIEIILSLPSTTP